jgi:glycosyltransferase involved in cell wall biosynthesis/SAM-dependent methyltransferase
MQNGKYIAARLWPEFGGDIPSRTPVILGINQKKYETISIYLTKNSDKPNIFEQSGKKVFYMTDKPQLPFFKLPVFFKLAKLLRREGVDILHCHKHKATVYGTIAGKLAGVPVILSHVHGLDRTRNFRRKLLNRFLFSKVSKILAVGQAVKEDILKSNSSVQPVKVINLGNSIDCDTFSKVVKDDVVKEKFGIKKDALVFATAGRLAPTKGLQYLIGAFAQIRKQLPNAQLLIAGSGEMKNELENLASKLGCGSNVHFPGRIDNMPQFYSCVDVFVLSSVAEGMPRALLEAMAAGIMCIASDVGGIPEIMDNGCFGFLVPPKNENALAGAMLKAANMPIKEKEIAAIDTKQYIKTTFSHIAMIKKVETVYDSLLSESKLKNEENLRNMFAPVTDIVCEYCSGYANCRECDTRGEYSFRRCQRMIETKYYGELHNKDVLEIGCGSSEKGGYIKSMTEANNCRWVGIDILPTNLATYVCSVEKMPFPDNSFDVVIGCHTIEHWKKPDKALREIRRVLRNDGMISLTAPIHQHGSKNFVLADFDALQKMILRNGFIIERFETWRRMHSDLPVYEPGDYSKRHLRKAGMLKYDNIERYVIHLILKINQSVLKN